MHERMMVVTKKMADSMCADQILQREESTGLETRSDDSTDTS